jgi:uncharacterized protein
VSIVFLDTVGMLALWDEADQWHANAQTAFEMLTSARHSVATTTFVLLECGNAAARRPYRNVVAEWRSAMSTNQGLISPTLDDWDTAWKAYERGEANQAGIVDHVSFVVMRRLGIRQAFTNDRHFAAAGFEVLIRGWTSNRRVTFWASPNVARLPNLVESDRCAYIESHLYR